MDRPRKSLHNKNNYIYPDNTGREYKKAFIIIFIFLVISLISTFGRGWGIKYFWQDFIAIFLIMSSGYDLIAKKWKPWPYLYPFIELVLGANLLLTNGSKFIYFLVATFCAVTGYSVVKQRSRHIQAMFACLDTSIRLPISLISLFESVILIITSIYLLIVY